MWSRREAWFFHKYHGYQYPKITNFYWCWRLNSNTLATWCKEVTQDPDAGKDLRQEEKGTTEDEMAEWHRWFNGHEFEQAPGVGDEQGSPAIEVHGVTKNRTWLNNWTELKSLSSRSQVFNPQDGKIPWRRKWQPTPVFLPGKSYGQRSLVARIHGVTKESDIT